MPAHVYGERTFRFRHPETRRRYAAVTAILQPSGHRTPVHAHPSAREIARFKLQPSPAAHRDKLGRLAHANELRRRHHFVSALARRRALKLDLQVRLSRDATFETNLPDVRRIRDF